MNSDRRNEVSALIHQAYTLEECLRAEAALQDWLREHPEDWAMYDLLSSLATTRAAAAKDAPVLPSVAAFPSPPRKVSV